MKAFEDHWAYKCNVTLVVTGILGWVWHPVYVSTLPVLKQFFVLEVTLIRQPFWIVLISRCTSFQVGLYVHVFLIHKNSWIMDWKTFQVCQSVVSWELWLILVVWNETVAVMTCPSKKLNDMPRQLMGLKQTDSSQKYAPTYLAPNEVCEIFRRGPEIPATVIMVVPRLLTIDCLLETHSLLSCIVPPMISIGTLILLYQKKRNAEQGQKSVPWCSQNPHPTWKIIPLSKWLRTLMLVSPVRLCFPPSKWVLFSWLIYTGVAS